MTREEISNNFTYRPPTASQAIQYESLRDAARRFAILVGDTCPNSAERTTALKKIQECIMWANTSIALHS